MSHNNKMTECLVVTYKGITHTVSSDDAERDETTYRHLALEQIKSFGQKYNTKEIIECIKNALKHFNKMKQGTTEEVGRTVMICALIELGAVSADSIMKVKS